MDKDGLPEIEDLEQELSRFREELSSENPQLLDALEETTDRFVEEIAEYDMEIMLIDLLILKLSIYACKKEQAMNPGLSSFSLN